MLQIQDTTMLGIKNFIIFSANTESCFAVDLYLGFCMTAKPQRD